MTGLGRVIYILDRRQPSPKLARESDLSAEFIPEGQILHLAFMLTFTEASARRWTTDGSSSSSEND